MPKKAAESKHEAFMRVATKRTNKIIDTLQLLGNLSNTSTYECTDAEAEKMFHAIEQAIQNTKKKFSKAATPKPPKFSF